MPADSLALPGMRKPTEALTDPFGRHVDYLRLSVTDRCDLRCIYCMPKDFGNYEEPANWLTFDEIARILRLFCRRGLRRVRLTGGEPLLRSRLAARGHANAMHHPPVDDRAGGGHHAIAHDVRQTFSFFERDLHPPFSFATLSMRAMVARKLAQPVPRTLMLFTGFTFV